MDRGRGNECQYTINGGYYRHCQPDGGPPTGFINPGIYKLAASQNTLQAYRDIINGSNAVDKGNIHVAGFTAQPGWDAVTGWGSPQASQFIPALIAALK